VETTKIAQSGLTQTNEFIDNNRIKIEEFMLNMPSQVHNPQHYNTGSIEAILYLEDNMPLDAFIGYLEGSVKKYLHRWRYKNNPVQDLEKAMWYNARLVWKLKGNMLKDYLDD